MKLFLSAVLLAVILPSSAPAIEYSHECDALIQEHDRAVAAALDPVHRRFQQQLEALQRKATAANDLETALRIKKMLEELGESSGGSAKSDIAGTWILENKTAGGKFPFKYLPDGAITRDNVKAGTWDIQGKQLICSYTTGVVDRYELPVRAGKLVGTNSSNHTVTLTRRGQ